MRYIDGGHHWPYTPYIPLGATAPLNPIEYPALTGLVVWVLTYIDLGFANPVLNYYYLNHFISAILFIAMVLLISRLTRPALAFLVALSPAAIRSLSLNWDVWAVLPMIGALALFQVRRYTLSSVLLAVSIATKFFPVVLLLPMVIFFLRERRLKDFFNYLGKTVFVWILINVPFLLVDAAGWSFFYRFSFQRSVGEGSFYTLFGKMGLPIDFPQISYYLFNILIFLALILFLYKSKKNHDILTTSFLAVFAFTIFGKQYSMQYILWLLPLAILSLRDMNWRKNRSVFLFFICWQVAEYFFHLAYFKNLFSRVMVERGVEVSMLFSDERYGVTALIRYVSLLAFTVSLLLTLYNKTPIALNNKRPGSSTTKK